MPGNEEQKKTKKTTQDKQKENNKERHWRTNNVVRAGDVFTKTRFMPVQVFWCSGVQVFWCSGGFGVQVFRCIGVIDIFEGQKGDQGGCPKIELVAELDRLRAREAEMESARRFGKNGLGLCQL